MDKTPEQIAAEAAAKAAADAAANAGEPAEDGEKPKTSDELQAELTRTAAALSSANHEAETRRKRIKELEDEKTKREQNELSELEREKAGRIAAEKLAAESQERAKQTLIQAALVSEGANLGVAHPKDLFRLADLSAVTCDDDGNVIGAEAAVAALVKEGRVPMKDARKAPNLDGGAGGGSAGGGGKAIKLTSEELEMARKMGLTEEQAAAQKAAIAKMQQTA